MLLGKFRFRKQLKTDFSTLVLIKKYGVKRSKIKNPVQKCQKVFSSYPNLPNSLFQPHFFSNYT